MLNDEGRVMTLDEYMLNRPTTIEIDGTAYTLRQPTDQERAIFASVTSIPNDDEEVVAALQTAGGMAMMLKIMFDVPYQSARAAVDAELNRVAAMIREEMQHCEQTGNPWKDRLDGCESELTTPHVVSNSP